MADRKGATLSICTRCRAEGKMVPDDMRPGYRLAQAIYAKFGDSEAARSGMALRGVRCMSQCKRPCAIALSAPDKFTLLFGDLDPDEHADAVLELAAQFADQPDGLVARADRPEPLRAGILGRIPPLSLHGDPIDPDFSIPSNFEPS
ncbi:MAG: DUF1636 domain-containing protein [Pseudomonadota bacterium]